MTDKEFCRVMTILLDTWQDGLRICRNQGMTEAEAVKLVGQKMREQFLPKTCKVVRQPDTINTEGGNKK